MTVLYVPRVHVLKHCPLIQLHSSGGTSESSGRLRIGLLNVPGRVPRDYIYATLHLTYHQFSRNDQIVYLYLSPKVDCVPRLELKSRQTRGILGPQIDLMDANTRFNRWGGEAGWFRATLRMMARPAWQSVSPSNGSKVV